MPPPNVRSIRDLIFWQFGKVMSSVEGSGKSNHKVTLDNFTHLKMGSPGFMPLANRIANSGDPNHCAYCCKHTLVKPTLLLSAVRGGPNVKENMVMACGGCIKEKGDKRLYEWYGLDKRDMLPDVAEAKYLLLLYRLHEQRRDLDESFVPNMCARCDMEELCPEKQVLSVYCLEGCFKKV